MGHYRASFTANGHSIRVLKDRAAKLKAERGCTHNEALDQVARSIGYTSWQAVMAEPSDPKRDEFFSHYYQRNDRSQPEYLAYLASRAITDTPDAFREHLVETYAAFCDLGFDQCALDREPGDPDEFTEQLKAAVDRDGPQALLPQAFSDEMLERLLGHTRLAFVHMRHEGAFSLPPTRNLAPVFYCVARLTHHRVLQRNPRAAEFQIKLWRVKQATEVYHMRLELEFISRRTRVKVEQPTLETVLVAPEHIGTQVASAK
jgi:hypothetical protein